jgi:hypothetical protein
LTEVLQTQMRRRWSIHSSTRTRWPR